MEGDGRRVKWAGHVNWASWTKPERKLGLQRKSENIGIWVALGLAGEGKQRQKINNDNNNSSNSFFFLNTHCEMGKALSAS